MVEYYLEDGKGRGWVRSLHSRRGACRGKKFLVEVKYVESFR